jgi:branched-chain amino acid transport system substrate-binding protein
MLLAVVLSIVLAACSGSAVSEGGDEVSEAAAGGGATETEGEGSEAAAPEGEPIQVGLLIPTSGVYTLLGEDIRQGFELYLEEHDGALGGRPVETVEADEGETAETGVRAGQRLLNEDQVDAMVGIVSSAVALGLRDVVDEAQVPLVIANAGANDVTGARFSDYIFRTSFANRQPNFAMGEHLAAEGVTDVFAIAPDYAAGREQIAGFRESFEAGGGTVVGEVFPPFTTTQDYQPFLQQIRDSGAEAVYAFFSGGEAITFVQQYQQFGLAGEIPLYGPGFLTDETVLPTQGAAAEGVQTSLHYTALLENPVNEEFAAAYDEAYGEPPTVFAVGAYDAAQLLDLALTDFEGEIADDPEGFVEALEGVGELDSPRGPFALDEQHNPEQTFYLLEVQPGEGGEYVNAVLDELGTVESPGG